MLLVDLQGLRDGPIPIDAVVPACDPLLADMAFELAQPVAVRGRLSAGGPGQFYWHGTMSTVVAGACRRCLTAVETPLDIEIRAVFAEAGAAGDEAAMHEIPVGVRDLDLAPAVREELILAAPDFAVCREDCLGLCDQCGKNLNEGPCDCRPEPDARWAALEALKTRWADDEES